MEHRSWFARVFLDFFIFDIATLDMILDLFKCHVTNLLAGTLKIFKCLICIISLQVALSE